MCADRAPPRCLPVLSALTDNVQQACAQWPASGNHKVVLVTNRGDSCRTYVEHGLLLRSQLNKGNDMDTGAILGLGQNLLGIKKWCRTQVHLSCSDHHEGVEEHCLAVAGTHACREGGALLPTGSV